MKAAKPETRQPVKLHTYHLAGGWTVLAGKNDRDNDWLTFKVAENISADTKARRNTVTYPVMTKTLGSFKLTVEEGGFSDSEIIVMLGQNGTGKTTFMKRLRE